MRDLTKKCQKKKNLSTFIIFLMQQIERRVHVRDF